MPSRRHAGDAAAPGMIRISSRMTRFFKVFFPTFWFGVLMLGPGTALMAGDKRVDPVFLIGPALMGVVGFFVMKTFVWDLVDEVYDAGDHLVIETSPMRTSSRCGTL